MRIRENLLGLEIGGTKLQIVLGNEQARIVRRWRHSVQLEAGAAGIRAQIEQTLEQIRRQFSVQAVGVGFGGPVDWREGRICKSHQIEGWSEFHLGQWLEARWPGPVRIDNDANLGALGEALQGAGRGHSPVFYVTLGSGVGGGLVADGKIFHGTVPGESEIGHVRLDSSGTIVEERCSGWAVNRRIRQAILEAPSSFLANCVRETGAAGNEAACLGPALAKGDPLAESILSDTARDLGFALSHVTHLFHPEIIVLGGGLALIGEPLRDAVERHLSQFVMEAFRSSVRVALAELKEDAVPVGALELARSASRKAD